MTRRASGVGSCGVVRGRKVRGPGDSGGAPQGLRLRWRVLASPTHSPPRCGPQIRCDSCPGIPQTWRRIGARRPGVRRGCCPLARLTGGTPGGPEAESAQRPEARTGPGPTLGSWANSPLPWASGPRPVPAGGNRRVEWRERCRPALEEGDVDGGGVEVDKLEDEHLEGEGVLELGLRAVHFCGTGGLAQSPT